MHDVGASWLMTTLAPTPLLVALVSAAGSLPIFLLSLPAGALADILDRRRLLMTVQLWNCAAATTAALLTWSGLITPWLLLLFTFLIGMGGALHGPAWQAVMPELVPRSQLTSAVTLGSVSMNISRTVGPAVGGLAVSLAGPEAAFALNAVSFLGVSFAVWRWRREPRNQNLPPERFRQALRTGMRYVRHHPELRAVLLRLVAFLFAGSAMWPLLPLVARMELGQSAGGYGIMLACVGVGALAAAALLPRFRARLGMDQLSIAAVVVFALVAVGVAMVPIYPAVCAILFVGGAAWVTVLTSMNSSAQASVPSWVRARAMSVYLLTFFGTMSAGATAWGSLATYTNVQTALLSAAACMVLGLAAALRYRLPQTEGLDLSPSMHWPEPHVAHDLEQDRGPVLITVEYRIDLADAPLFIEAAWRLRRARLRDGGYRWGLFEDVSAPGKYVETFVVESWAEHLRQHARVTVADQAIQEIVRQFHRGDEPPVVTHLVHVERSAPLTG